LDSNAYIPLFKGRIFCLGFPTLFGKHVLSIVEGRGSGKQTGII
jgi:hypothetical protein